MQPCPRGAEATMGVQLEHLKTSHWREDDTCSYCGSLNNETFMRRLEAGDVELGPTDKTYKVYVKNVGGESFKVKFRTDKPDPVTHQYDSDPAKWTWTTETTDQTKFYFQHLTADERHRFIELLNAKRIKFGYPGRFYVLPFFATRVDPPKDGASC